MPESLILDLQQWLLTLALISPRALVCMSIIPGVLLKSTTGTMRSAVAIALVLPEALPTYQFVHETPPGFLLSFLLIFKESAIGLVIGVMLSLPFWAAESIGSLLDRQRIPIQVQSNNGSVDKDASAVGGLMVQALTLVMIHAGLFVALVRILLESFGVWHTFNLAPPFEVGHFEVVVQRFGEFFWHIIVYGAPVIIPMLLIDMVFAMIGVFITGMQVSFVSSPVKSLVGLLVLLLYWPIFSHYILGDFSHLLDFTTELLQGGGKH